MKKKIQIAVLLEWHPYDVVNLQKMLWSFDDCEFYVQPLDLFAADEENQDMYDAVIYYNMSLPDFEDDSKVKAYLENKLGQTKQGIILLHHAVLSWPKWDLWTDVTGLKIRCVDGIFEYHQNETVDSKIANSDHPITKGIKDWTMLDETYIIGEPVKEGNTVLIKTDNAKSIKKIAWTRTYKKSKVFCYASGHDNQAYGNENFRKILHNAIHWCIS